MRNEQFNSYNRNYPFKCYWLGGLDVVFYIIGVFEEEKTGIYFKNINAKKIRTANARKRQKYVEKYTKCDKCKYFKECEEYLLETTNYSDENKHYINGMGHICKLID